MSLDIVLEININKLEVKTKNDFTYYLLWNYYSFTKDKKRKKKSKKFKNSDNQLKNFKTKIYIKLPQEIENKIKNE